MLGAWNGTAAGNDLISLPAGATFTLEQGQRTRWTASTSELRALEAPDQSVRRSAAFYHDSSLRLRLNFANAYAGTLHLYAVDWDKVTRRQTVTVSNGSSSQTIAISDAFNQGAWLHFPVSVAAGGALTVTVNDTGTPNALVAGLFLGGAGSPPPPPPPPYEVAPQGDWVGVYGGDGYVLGAWNGTAAGNDLISLPAGVTFTLEQGQRTRWTASTSELRALEAPDQSVRRSAAFYHDSSLRLRLNFANAYAGTLHLYAVDWDKVTRRQTVTVSNGSSSQTIAISDAFNQGAWLHFPVSVAAGGALTVTVNDTGTPNALVAGLFLGGAGSP